MKKSLSAYSEATTKEELERHIMVVWVDNEAGVLARVSGLFSGRGYNIESLTVAQVDDEKNISRITIAGHPLLQTSADPSGRAVLGTVANCSNGKTPWNTYLTCEENFQDYFQPGDASTTFSERHTRYQIPSDDLGAQWYRHEARFDLSRSHTNRIALAGSWRSTPSTRRTRRRSGPHWAALPMRTRRFW